ncbi:MAG: fumarylacetoacetate hydrolase family protein [Eubacterium sp.]|nr:fumarylacetoacetate hydrolase family protein [Eubacterium sp.]
MKLITYIYENKENIGVLNADETRVIPLSSLGIDSPSMNDLISDYTLEALVNTVSSQLDNLDVNTCSISLAEVTAAPPIPSPRQDIICLGINYWAHAEESARYKKEAFDRDRTYPIYFAKRVNRAVADGEMIDSHRDMFQNLDYESELAVIIGKPCKNATLDNAKDHIFGYTIVNDMSAREIQTRHKQWYFGKSLDEFTPMGPCIVTADEIPYPPHLDIKSYVNGELRQNSNTELLINDIDYVICELSQGMTLLPGTIISTGTPAGVGMGFEPPKFLSPGDEVICEIQGIGQLKNKIK